MRAVKPEHRVILHGMQSVKMWPPCVLPGMMKLRSISDENFFAPSILVFRAPLESCALPPVCTQGMAPLQGNRLAPLSCTSQRTVLDAICKKFWVLICRMLTEHPMPVVHTTQAEVGLQLLLAVSSTSACERSQEELGRGKMIAIFTPT
jgi:hypothetical protein